MINKLNDPALMSLPREQIAERLIYKLENVGVERLADYIGLTLDLLRDKEERIKVAKADLDSIAKAAKGQAIIIREEVAKFLEANGVEKIEGDRLSSITLSTPAPKKKLVIHNKEALLHDERFIKVSLDETKIKNNIEEIGKEIAEIELIESATIAKINKRKEV